MTPRGCGAELAVARYPEHAPRPRCGGSVLIVEGGGSTGELITLICRDCERQPLFEVEEAAR